MPQHPTPKTETDLVRQCLACATASLDRALDESDVVALEQAITALRNALTNS